MDKNSNYFDIYSYIYSNLDEASEEEDMMDKVVVCMDIDSNQEPYIEITYMDGIGTEAGLNNLAEFEFINNYYDDVFDTYPDDSVISVVYDSATKKLNLIRLKNGNYRGNKSYEDYENAIFVGYIIDETFNLSYQNKIKMLYKVMKQIMDSAYECDYEEDFVFKVKDKWLTNVNTIKTWKAGFVYVDDCENYEQKNLDIIKSVFGVDLKEESIQKVKK